MVDSVVTTPEHPTIISDEKRSILIPTYVSDVGTDPGWLLEALAIVASDDGSTSRKVP